MEAFFKAAAKGGKGFSRIFSKKKVPGTPGGSAGAYTVEDLLMYSNVSSLLSSLVAGQFHSNSSAHRQQLYCYYPSPAHKHQS